MIKVKGTDFRTVDLKDIRDRVYFGQEKVFSQSQLDTSKDLQRAIKDGKVQVLSQESQVSPNFSIPESRPEPVVVEKIVEAPAPPPNQKLEDLMGMVADLAKQVDKLTGEKSKPPVPSLGVEAAIAGLAKQIAEIKESVNKSGNISQKLERVEKSISKLTVSGPGVRLMPPSGSSQTEEEVFVPSSFQVTDMSNNVRLESKNLGQGGTVNEALAKLKALKNDPDKI